jgi:tetratricopeptide (TPR) repeat protein
MVRASKRRRPARPLAYGASGEGRGGKIPLRLAVTKGGLGLELDQTLALGFLDVEKLLVSLVGLSFPVDLSGGVARFRHRRGALEHLSVSARRDKVLAALAPRMRGIVGPATPTVTIAAISGGVMVGLVSGMQALAFDVLWAPSESDARFVVCGARSIGLETPALAAALRAVDGVVAHDGEREGCIAKFSDAAHLVAEHVLPGAGARVPDTGDIRWGPLEADTFGFRAACDRAFSPPLLAAHVVRELELAKLAEQGDTALAAGDLETARNAYVALLERAPRDPDLARRLADLDRVVGGRADAALATLLETMTAAEAGFLAGELLAATDSPQGSVLALRQAAEREVYGPLAALALLRASQATETIRERLELLDQAVARSPALEAPRWARFALRLELADLKGAMVDAEHLEAAARGAHKRHDVWRRAAEGFLSHGHHAKAITLFERALRYSPDDPSAISGLARSLMLAGRSGRALDLMARAVELADRKGVAAHDAVLALARALADSAGDLPHAIARLRTIPAGEPESLDARGLEARYRANLGDLAGASIAFAQMRDVIELAKEVEPQRASAWLVEAARFERHVKKDPLAAQRHLGAALQLSPRDGKILSLFREVAAETVRAGSENPRKSEPQAPASDPAVDEERAMRLTDQLRGDPASHSIALELCHVLARLGRDLDLFALLSARLEDATEETLPDLLPLQKAVLARLVDRASRERRADDERMYRTALARLV